MKTADEINTHGIVCDFGRHRGERYTRIPVGYLRWMVNIDHSNSDIAEAELKRRGTTMPDMELSGHAIDRASLFCRKIWHETRRKEEGINSWLLRVGKEALDKGLDSEGRAKHLGMKFVFQYDGKWPVMKTVMRLKERK